MTLSGGRGWGWGGCFSQDRACPAGHPAASGVTPSTCAQAYTYPCSQCLGVEPPIPLWAQAQTPDPPLFLAMDLSDPPLGLGVDPPIPLWVPAWTSLIHPGPRHGPCAIFPFAQAPPSLP